MSAIPQTNPAQLKPTLVHNLEKKPVPPSPQSAAVIATKLGIFGGTGSGKTTTAALAALWLSKTYHGGAPVWVTDTEPGWQFLGPLFAQEGVELIQRTVPTFQAMCADIRAAEKAGACVWVVDSLTIIWQELLRAARGNRSFIPLDQWGSIKSTWNEYTTLFLNSPMHCFALGRLQNDMQEIEVDQKDEQGRITTTTKTVTVGTKFKAGGGESFGYEPHLLLELSLERKAKRKAGIALEGEGRMVHRADVLKDRTWALNGKVIRWSDKASYQTGGFRQVGDALLPHFAAVQRTMKRVNIESGSSQGMFDASGNSEFYQMRQRRDAMCAEIKGCMDMFFGGQGKEDKQLRLAVNDLLFGVKSKEAADALPYDKLERGLRILHAYEKIPVKKMDSPQAVLIEMTACIAEYDRGESEEWDIPF